LGSADDLRLPFELALTGLTGCVAEQALVELEERFPGTQRLADVVRNRLVLVQAAATAMNPAATAAMPWF